MRRQAFRRRLLTVPIVAIAGLLSFGWLGPWPVTGQSPVHKDWYSCRDLEYPSFDPADASRRSGDDVVVPIVIHLMTAALPASARRASADDFPRIAPSEDWLIKIWSEDRIKKYFVGDVGASQIWRDHRLRLAIVRVERCRYSPQHFRTRVRPEDVHVDSVFTPASNMPGHAGLFAKFQRAYGVLNRSGEAQRQALDVYLWWSISEGSNEGSNAWGYGRSRDAGGPAAWADIACVMTRSGTAEIRRRLQQEHNAAFDDVLADLAPKMDSESQCGRILAHEIGHALGLKHVAPRENLMHPTYDGSALNNEQVKRAKEHAREYFPAVNPPQQ
jgi:hypothetical protein